MYESPVKALYHKKKYENVVFSSECFDTREDFGEYEVLYNEAHNKSTFFSGFKR